ncbi:kinesin-domain-containing protein, partial [Hyphopichia burtonii NRRL Y-1933]
MSSSQRSSSSFRSRSSLSNPASIPGLSNGTQQSALPRVNITDLRRPPSARSSFRPSSPRISNGNSYSTNSRPGSSLSNKNASSTTFPSRPSTPSATSFRNYEPYTGTITVSIRPNPYSVSESQPLAWDIEELSNTIANSNDGSSFTFDNVFPANPSITNREVYNRSCSQIVNNYLNEGYNGTIFAYGMTGSGKTFSMRGSDEDPGFVRLAIDEIFCKIENSVDSSKKQYTINLSYLEIYNEKIIDLLSEVSSNSSQDLKIRDDPVYGTRIIGITSPTISTKSQMLDLIKNGDNKRKTSATDFNARSSRSHSILQVKLNTIDISSRVEQHATLSLCDLAGSERATSSVERRKEGAYINKSLLALSTVINKLSMSTSFAGGGSPTLSEHIPYRDSKLTRLLQPALSGSSLVSILCTVHLGSNSSTSNNNQQFISETANTLRFAARAKDIVMHVNTNRKTSVGDPESIRVIEELKATIDNQKQEIQMLKLNGVPLLIEKDVKIAQLESEIKILNEKLEHLSRLTDLQKTETVLLRNDALNDLLGVGIDNNSLQIMMSNLEDFYKRINYEMDEHKSYINHLENQLRIAFEHISRNSSISSNTSVKLPTRKLSNESRCYSDRHIDMIMKDQEEEICHLKEMLKDKDHIIHGLTKTSKLRRLVDSSTIN